MTQALEVARGAAVPRPRANPRPHQRPALRLVTPRSSRRIVAFAVLAIVFTLVSAVVFHVILAQGQLQLDRLDRKVSVARREYEQRRLETATLGSPERIIQEAQRIGLERPPAPPQYLEVPGAPPPPADSSATATTFGDWERVKSHLGDGP